MKLNNNELIKYVKGMQRGDKDAFESIYKAFFQYAYHVVKKTYFDDSSVEDIVQEAFITAFNAVHKLKKPSAFKPWFDRVLCGAIEQAYRKNTKTFVQEDTYFNELPEMNEELLPESSFECKEIRQQVIKAVSDLPFKQRQVIIAHYFQQLKIADIAESLQIHEGSVKNALYNARKSLRKKLTPSTTDTFLLPLAFILRSEFESSSVSSNASDTIWRNVLQASKPPPLLNRLAAHLGVAGSLSQAAALLLIIMGVVTGGISVAVQYPYTLADMLGPADAALLIEICEASSEANDDKLNSLLERHEIIPHTRGFTVGEGNEAETFILIKGRKRLYVIRARNYSEYLVKYRFEPKSYPGLALDDLYLLLESGEVS